MRKSGILLPVFSLPSDYGFGTFGKKAYEFVDFLRKSGQHYWQVLPLGPVSYGDSPYSSFSTFAGNHYYIDLESLVNDGLLTYDEINKHNFGDNKYRVDYGKMFESRIQILKLAFSRGFQRDSVEVMNFRAKNIDWLNDYALFMSLKKHFDYKQWQDWDEDIKIRKDNALVKYSTMLQDEMNFHIYLQFLFGKQWEKLKKYANENKIEIIGDVPIYVAADSSDCWANSKMFMLDSDKNPTLVAGCPPDGFSPDGQLWGNPCYDWEYLRKSGYKWWIDRISHSRQMYDIVRIDHFRGFEAYYAIDAKEETARNGKWKKGPGIKLFDAIKEKIGDVEIIAEDLGHITKEVEQLLKSTSFPGMKILQFAFSPYDDNPYLPHNYTSNSVVYTGTHDNQTTTAWANSLSNESRDFCVRYLNITEKEGITWGMIRAAMSSVSKICIIPMQDFLCLDDCARLNTPSTIGENWKWRTDPSDFSELMSNKILEITKRYRR